MKQFILCAILLFSLAACRNESLAPETGIFGSYAAIIDPLRCSLPTTQNLKIVAAGEKLDVTYDYFSEPQRQMLGVTVEESNGEYKLFYKGTEVGQYKKDTYMQWNGKKFENVEGMVLYLHYGPVQSEHIAFMGAK